MLRIALFIIALTLMTGAVFADPFDPAQLISDIDALDLSSGDDKDGRDQVDQLVADAKEKNATIDDLKIVCAQSKISPTELMLAVMKHYSTADAVAMAIECGGLPSDLIIVAIKNGGEPKAVEAGAFVAGIEAAEAAALVNAAVEILKIETMETKEAGPIEDGGNRPDPLDLRDTGGGGGPLPGGVEGPAGGEEPSSTSPS